MKYMWMDIKNSNRQFAVKQKKSNNIPWYFMLRWKIETISKRSRSFVKKETNAEQNEIKEKSK